MLCKERWGIPGVKGEVGIEIEVEGRGLPEAPPGWKGVRDGSLRGESIEYVLRRPVDRKDVSDYLKRIKLAYIQNKTKVMNSDRCSVHVHLNMQDHSISHAFNTILLFLIFEEILVNWCGETREGNLFCLRAQDAEFLLDFLEDLATQQIDLDNINTDLIRYASVNANSLAKYGSIEFRSMRGTDDINLIQTWINILLKIKDFATNVDSPLEMMELFSSHNLADFVELVFEEHSDIIFIYPKWQEAVRKGIHNVQAIAYLGHWESIDRVVEPFKDI